MDTNASNGPIFLALYVILIISTMSVTLTHDFDNVYKTPKKIYERTDLNMFGCILLWLFFIITNPFGYFVSIIYFIFHVGRKHKEEDDYFGI